MKQTFFLCFLKKISPKSISIFEMNLKKGPNFGLMHFEYAHRIIFDKLCLSSLKFYKKNCFCFFLNENYLFYRSKFRTF